MAHPIAIAIAAAGAYMGLKLVKKVAKIATDAAQNSNASGADGTNARHREELPTLRQDPETGVYEIDKNRQ